MQQIYSTRAVSGSGGRLPFTGPGISALRMFMERSVLPESMVMNTSTPMPPTQWGEAAPEQQPVAHGLHVRRDGGPGGG